MEYTSCKKKKYLAISITFGEHGTVCEEIWLFDILGIGVARAAEGGGGSAPNGTFFVGNMAW